MLVIRRSARISIECLALSVCVLQTGCDVARLGQFFASHDRVCRHALPPCFWCPKGSAGHRKAVSPTGHYFLIVYSLDFATQNRELLRSKTAMTWRSSGDGSPTLAGVENRPAHRLRACAQPLRGSSVSHPLTLPLCLSNSSGNQNRRRFHAGKQGVGLEGAAPKAWEVGKAQPPGVRVRAPNQRFERQRGGATHCGGGYLPPRLRGHFKWLDH